METFGDLAWTLREELLADCRAAENPDWPGTTTSNAARALQGQQKCTLCCSYVGLLSLSGIPRSAWMPEEKRDEVTKNVGFL